MKLKDSLFVNIGTKQEFEKLCLSEVTADSLSYIEYRRRENPLDGEWGLPESVKLNRQKQNHFIIRKNRAKNIKNI